MRLLNFLPNGQPDCLSILQPSNYFISQPLPIFSLNLRDKRLSLSFFTSYPPACLTSQSSSHPSKHPAITSHLPGPASILRFPVTTKLGQIVPTSQLFNLYPRRRPSSFVQRGVVLSQGCLSTCQPCLPPLPSLPGHRRLWPMTTTTTTTVPPARLPPAHPHQHTPRRRGRPRRPPARHLNRGTRRSMNAGRAF